MNYRSLGKSELQVSILSFGCMSLGENDAENARIIHHAIENGINYFDTADLYQKGQNEQTVGKALKGKRDKVILSSKVDNQWRADGSGWDWNPKKEYILSSVEGSLKRLNTDYIDLYQLHGGTIDDPIDDSIAAFEQLQQQGKIRFAGVCNYNVDLLKEAQKHISVVSNQVPYSMVKRDIETSVVPYCIENNINNKESKKRILIYYFFLYVVLVWCFI